MLFLGQSLQHGILVLVLKKQFLTYFTNQVGCVRFTTTFRFHVRGTNKGHTLHEPDGSIEVSSASYRSPKGQRGLARS